MSKTTVPDSDTVLTLLGVVADLLQGTRHCRRTLAKATGKSLPTADRWIEAIAEKLPGARRLREGKTTWLVYEDRRRAPSPAAALGACIAASVAVIFEGSEHERNLKDARDYILRERGDAFTHLDRKFVLHRRGGEYALPQAAQALDLVVSAVLESRRLRFTYSGTDDRIEHVVVEPLSLVLYEHQFYVLSRKLDRTFYPYRFARMSEIERLNERFEYPSKGEYDPTSVLSLAFGIHVSGNGPIEEVEIILSGAWANYAMSHRWHPTQHVTRLDDGSVRVVLRVRLCRELETWVLSFGEHARVVQPERLRKIVASRLSKASALYSAARPSLAKARRRSLAKGPKGRRSRSR